MREINANAPESVSRWTTEMIDASDQFVSQAASIAEINRTVIPEMEQKAEAQKFAVFDEVSKHLSKEEVKELRRYAKTVGHSLLEAADSAEKGKVKAVNLKLAGSAGAAMTHIFMQLSRSAKSEPQHQLLRNSLLVSAVSSFEILFGRTARSILQVNSAAFRESDHGFTLQQLAEFDTLNDAKEFLVERQVAKLLYDSVDGWDKWLKRAAGGVSMSELPVDWTVIREGFARRNLIVHADGVVNQIYLGALKNLDSRRDWWVHAGQKISVSEEYLAEFLQEIMALGRALSVAVGIKMRKAEQGAFLGALQSDVYRSIMSGHWRTAISLSKYCLEHDLPRDRKIRAQVNLWVARKSLLGVDDIRGEVEDWDVSGLALNLSHYKGVLLGEESATSQVRRLIEDGKLTIFDVAINPVYSGIKDDFMES